MGRITGTNSAARADVFTVDGVIQGVLINWGRWALPRHGGSGSTNAMFRMVKSPRTFDGTQSPSIPVDVDAAWLAEKVVCNPDFYPRARTLLSNHYVFNVDQRQTCRQLGLHRSAYDEEHWRSCYIFWNRYSRRLSS